MTRIVVFIDESGNPFENEFAFSTAATWCVVGNNWGREKPLEATIDSLKRYLIDDNKLRWAREIHHRGMPDEYVEFLLSMAINKSMSDNTIIREPIYWDKTSLRFTMNAGNPHAVQCLIPGMNAHRLGNYMRLSSIGNLLRPLCIYKGRKELQADIVFDAEVWKSVIERCDPNLASTINNPLIKPRIHYCKSSKTPGLQISDLAAGIVRQNLLHSTQRAAFRLLQSCELFRIKG